MNSIRYSGNSHNLQSVLALFILLGLTVIAGCASQPVSPQKTIYESGLNTVRLEGDPDSTSNTHPTALTPTEVGTLLRGVRSWERRNMIHQLFSGQADRTRAFRDEEILVLAPALSKALAQAPPTQRVYFHLSHATDQGEEETTTMRLGFSLAGGGADDLDDFVDVRVRQQQAFDRVFALPRASQQKLRSPANHRGSVADEFFQQDFERQNAGLAID